MKGTVMISICFKHIYVVEIYLVLILSSYTPQRTWRGGILESLCLSVRPSGQKFVRAASPKLLCQCFWNFVGNFSTTCSYACQFCFDLDIDLGDFYRFMLNHFPHILITYPYQPPSPSHLFLMSPNQYFLHSSPTPVLSTPVVYHCDSCLGYHC